MASGEGRCHLLLGQVDNAASPSAAAAELYTLTAGYGLATGDDALAVVETPDIAPLGELGRFRLRLLSCPVEYDAACRVRFTPIADYMTPMAPVTVALAAPGARRIEQVQAKVLRACTTIRLRVEVLERAGPVAVYTPMLYYTPLAVQSGVAMGEAP